MITEETIAELRTALEKATPGPWGIWLEPISGPSDAIRELTDQVNATQNVINSLVLLDAGGLCPATTGCGPTSVDNARLITLSRNHLPALLDDRQRLVEENARLREALRLAEGRIGLLLDSNLAESDHPTATRYVLAQIRKALSAPIKEKSHGVEAIAAERRRQISEEGWTPEHDDQHGDRSLAAAAAAYALNAAVAERYLSYDPIGFWPWDVSWWKPRTPREDLVRAGALIAAEIDRLDRAALGDPA